MDIKLIARIETRNGTHRYIKPNRVYDSAPGTDSNIDFQ